VVGGGGHYIQHNTATHNFGYGIEVDFSGGDEFDSNVTVANFPADVYDQFYASLGAYHDGNWWNHNKFNVAVPACFADLLD
jgi:hypothetical protein